MVSISLDFDVNNDAKIAVIGCGGAGGNAINTMIQEGMEDVTFVAINTDSQALSQNHAAMKIQIGEKTRKGLGCGAKPDCGFASAEEDEERIREVIEGNNMVFITAGLGGGTGTGSAPVVARIAKELEILTVAVVTKPFHFEGRKKMALAKKWIEELRHHVDSLIVISNQKIIETAGNVSFLEGFKRADSVLKAAVSGIADAITETGMVNIDFADIKTILSESGQALIGVGYGSGENKVFEAVKQAVENPLIEDMGIEGAGAILVNYRIGMDTTTNEIDEATKYITENAHEDATIIIGMNPDINLSSDAKVTIVATKFGEVIDKETLKSSSKIEVEKEVQEIEEQPEVNEEKQLTPPPMKEKKVVLKVHQNTGVIGLDRDSENLDIPTWIRNRKRRKKQA